VYSHTVQPVPRDDQLRELRSRREHVDARAEPQSPAVVPRRCRDRQHAVRRGRSGRHALLARHGREAGARRPSAATTSASTTASASATGTTSAWSSSASGPLPSPEGARAAARCREAEGPQGALLCRQGAPRARKALAARPRRQAVAAARHGQAPGLPGEDGRRPLGETETEHREGRPNGRPSFHLEDGRAEPESQSLRRAAGQGIEKARSKR
jgi:hypothetical protein